LCWDRTPDSGPYRDVELIRANPSRNSDDELCLPALEACPKLGQDAQSVIYIKNTGERERDDAAKSNVLTSRSPNPKSGSHYPLSITKYCANRTEQIQSVSDKKRITSQLQSLIG
jgi:hypothetical protein